MKKHYVGVVMLAASLTTPAFAASVRSQAEALLPAAQKIAYPYQRGLAEGWLEIAARQDSEVLVSHNHNDAAHRALQNAYHFIDGSVPFASIHGEKHWPTRNMWVKAISEIEAVDERASASACRGEFAGRLSALTDEVWKEQDETHGTHWVHGWAQIERTKKLSEQGDAELATCVAMPAALAPVATPVLLPAKPVSLAADALFDFDSAVLKSAGKQTIDALAKSLQDAGANDVVTVTVYADRLGSPAHNRDLSRQRAQAVADAMRAHGVKTEKFDVQGAGSAAPVASCPGRASHAVIECLAANRRVEVRVSGQGIQAQENL